MILNRRRFLAKYGLDDVSNIARDPMQNGSLSNAQTFKSQLIGLLQAIQYLRVPIIAANSLTVVFELVFGG